MSDLISKARSFAIEMHERFLHVRSNGEAYWHHPERVVATLKSLNVAPEVQAAGWLHDVPEDCASDAPACQDLLTEIERRFGTTVAALTSEVTNFFGPDATMDEKQQRLVEHAMHMSPDAKKIKLADRRDNISDMAGWTLNKRRRYARATIRLLAALEPLPQGTEALAAEIACRAESVLKSG